MIIVILVLTGLMMQSCTKDSEDIYGPWWAEAQTYNFPGAGCANTFPDLVSPPDSVFLDNGCLDRSDGIVWTFKWDDCTEAIYYQLQVWHDSASSFLIDIETPNSKYIHLQDSSYIVPKYGKNWHWVVIAFSEKGGGLRSETRTFDVEPLNSDCP